MFANQNVLIPARLLTKRFSDTNDATIFRYFGNRLHFVRNRIQITGQTLLILQDTISEARVRLHLHYHILGRFAIADHFGTDGKPCYYQFGFTYKGAGPRKLTQAKAVKLLPSYSFGMGFYELDWIEVNGEQVLLFNEFHENDLW